MIATKLFKDFVESERSGGIVLVCFTFLALIVANSPFADTYLHWMHYDVAGMSIEHWVNDGLMTIFFLLVGLELEREIYIGELRSFRDALLPICAAVGGMVVPAAIHLSLTYGTDGQRGAGIPMATDIAFSLGVLSLVSNRVPFALKVFLTALAIADDLGAVMVIAIFYTQSIAYGYLAGAIGVFLGLCLLNRLNVNSVWIYLVGGVAMWYCMVHSGVHATLAGVLLAFALPFRDGGKNSPSYGLQHALHRPVAFGILPLFAIVNTGIPIGSDWLEGLSQPNSLGIFLGLVIGKPAGILAFSFLAVHFKACSLPSDLRWSHVVGASMLAGIGFTMSIFVSILAFDDSKLVNFSQIMVLIASVVAAILGVVWFTMLVPQNSASQDLALQSPAESHG